MGFQARQVKTSISIQNALLRIDGITVELPPPFEHPNEKLEFWVLELPCLGKGDIASWCANAASILKQHTEMLNRLHERGAHFTLFIESGAAEPVFRLEVSFLKLLADLYISLEHSRADE